MLQFMLSIDREALNLELQTFATSCRGATPLHLAAWSVGSVGSLVFLLTHTDDDTLSSVLITVRVGGGGMGGRASSTTKSRAQSVLHTRSHLTLLPPL